MKEILFLSPRLPFPIVGGDKLKAYNTIKYLAKKHKVTLVSFFQGEQNKMPEYIKELENIGIEVFVLPLSPISAGISILPRIFKNIPLEVLYYTQKNFQKIVDELLHARKFDVIFSFFMRTAEYIKNSKIPKILMCEDCRTLYQKRSADNSKNLIQKIIRNWEYRKLLIYEPKIVDFFDVVTLVTHRDIAEMQKLNNKPYYELLTNGVDINKFVPGENNSRSKNTILFAGKLDVWANELMVQKIINNIFPIIQQKVPDVNLNIVGASPPSSIITLARSNNQIRLIANVPDMLPHLQTATLFLHPHAGGSGIQNKLLEAMAAGCPVVTTSTGNQGIEAINGESVLLGRNNEELAEHAINLLLDNNLAEKISANARKLIVDTHSWDAVLSATDKIFDYLDEIF